LNEKIYWFRGGRHTAPRYQWLIIKHTHSPRLDRFKISLIAEKAHTIVSKTPIY